MKDLTLSCHPVLQEVFSERIRQDHKWGEQNHPDGTGEVTAVRARDHAQAECELAFQEKRGTYRHILTEEYYEVLAETDPRKLRLELIQLAAVAVQWVEALDRRVPELLASRSLPDSNYLI